MKQKGGWHSSPLNDPNFRKRNTAIAKQYIPGKTSMEQIGNKYGLTRERIRQILKAVRSGKKKSSSSLHGSLR